jgi:hypothetical protein
VSKKLISIRMSEAALERLEELRKVWGLNQTEVILRALDLLWAEHQYQRRIKEGQSADSTH